MTRTLAIFAWLVLCSHAIADSPPDWMPFKVASQNSEYVAEVRVSDKKGETHPWLWSYELTVTRAGGATPLWSAAYNFNGYPGGVLSNDGEYFAFAEYWYCEDCAAATFYHRG